MRRFILGLAIVFIAALSPCWVHADDQQIAQQIVQQLRQEKADGRLSGFGIDLEVESGIVWLKGHVANREQHQRVLEIARTVTGVQQVVNDLQISGGASKPEATAASRANADASTALLQKPGQLLTNFNRNVKRALGAESETPVAAKAKSPEPTPAQAAKPVPATQVSQTRPAAPSDAELAEEVIGRLSAQKDRGELRNFDIDVQVNNQVVWISGHVASDAQRTLVLDVARRVRGVKQVVNDIQVASAAPAQVVSATASPVAVVPAPVHQGVVGAAAGAVTAPAPFPYAAAPTPAAAPAPLAFAPAQSVAYTQQMMGQPMPEVPAAAGIARARFDNPVMPGYAWPSYAAYPNYGAVTYPRQYSPTAWPYIGPFYPYPQVPLGWRKVTLEWDDGWWMLDFKSK